MDVEIIAVRQLSDRLASQWIAVQESNPALVSPYFRPEFTLAVSSVRADTFVAVLDGGTAFFPFQRNRAGFGGPVGGPVSDYHGLIAPPGYVCAAEDLARACGLRCWDFSHVPANQTTFWDCQTARTESFLLNLRTGAQPGSTRLRAQFNRKRRQLQREFGFVEVVLDRPNHELLSMSLGWKSAQYRRTGQSDLFAQRWARQLMLRLASFRGPAFSGVTSVLLVEGRPAAIHFGMRSRGVLHYWFPAYDVQFSHFSPGMLLLFGMIAGAGELGIGSIDFGAGAQDYKLRLANEAVPLMQGSIVADSYLKAWRRRARSLVHLAHRAGIKELIPMSYREALRGVIGPPRRGEGSTWASLKSAVPNAESTLLDEDAHRCDHPPRALLSRDSG